MPRRRADQTSKRRSKAPISAGATPKTGVLQRFAAGLAGRPGLVAATIGLVTLALFLPAVWCGFVNWDDGRYVYDNPLVLGGLSAAAARHAFTDVVFSNWAPLTILSYQLDATLFGTGPAGFHATNVLVHAVSASLLYLALVRMTGAAGPSAVAALLFALHPLRVESVVWIAERKDVLSVLFLMLALLAYERYCRSPGIGRYAAVAAAMLGSLLCKSTLVTLPALLLLLDVWPLGRVAVPGVGRPLRGGGSPAPYAALSWRQAVLEKIPLFVLSIVFAAITLGVQAGAIQGEEAMPLLAARIPNAIYAGNWYLWKTIWPTGLCPFHRHVGADLPLGLLAALAANLVALAAVGWKLARPLPFLAWGLAWFAVAALPMLGIVQAGFQGCGDRFTYVPHIGLVTAAVWAVAALARRLRLPGAWLTAATALLCVALSVGTLRQIRIWSNSETLWTSMLRQDPANFMAHLKLANYLVAAGRLREAEPHYRAAVEHAPNDRPGHVCRMTALANLACLYFDLGDRERAWVIRDRALAIDADDVAVRRMVEHVGAPASAGD